MNTNQSISFSPETLEELARIIRSLYPTMGEFFTLLNSAENQVFANQPVSSAGFSVSRRGFNSFAEPYYQPIQNTQLEHETIVKSLHQLNQSPGFIKALIETVFKPKQFRNRSNVLHEIINQFNDCLSFDGWHIQIQPDGSIGFIEAKPDLSRFEVNENMDKSLDHAFDSISFGGISHNTKLNDILCYRLTELRKCLDQEASLASIILAGSILEGVLRGIAEDHPRIFNTAATAPKDGSNTRPFRAWSLANFIDVAAETGFLNKGTKAFNHILRDFRNYIHPYEQLANRFDPDMATARLCLQTMKETLLQLQQHLKETSAPPA